MALTKLSWGIIIVAATAALGTGLYKSNALDKFTDKAPAQTSQPATGPTQETPVAAEAPAQLPPDAQKVLSKDTLAAPGETTAQPTPERGNVSNGSRGLDALIKAGQK
jgi:hypothetical protein